MPVFLGGGVVAVGTGGGERLAVSVHGPVGVLDLVVPSGAVAIDVASEYAEQVGLASIPMLFTRLGTPLLPHVALADAGVGSGDVLVAATALQRPAPPRAHTTSDEPSPAPGPGAASVLWFCIAVGAAVLAAWLTTYTPSEGMPTTVVLLLLTAAVVGVLPVGRLAGPRAAAAPAFAAAAAFAWAWDPHTARLPLVVGFAALAAAVAAAVARALDRRNEEVLRVWVAVGVAIFLVAGSAALLGLPPRVPWALLLLAGLLAARFVPSLAVDVPDQYLIDLERLAVTAWSARDRPPDRRGRSVVAPAAVAAVAARGSRIVTASCVAVLGVVAVAAPMLLVSAPVAIDRIGARCLVFFCGCGLLLAARSFRHLAARALLRAAGIACGVALLVSMLETLGPRSTMALAAVAIALAAVLVVVAVATGRGWRSAWWSRRAELAETLCGSAAVASVFVASGVVHSLWASIHLHV